MLDVGCEMEDVSDRLPTDLAMTYVIRDMMNWKRKLLID